MSLRVPALGSRGAGPEAGGGLLAHGTLRFTSEDWPAVSTAASGLLPPAPDPCQLQLMAGGRPRAEARGGLGLACSLAGSLEPGR